MSKRLQVLLPDDEMTRIVEQAELERVPVGEFVRRSLREVIATKTTRTVGGKLAALQEALKHGYPTASVKEMNRQIERSYRK